MIHQEERYIAHEIEAYSSNPQFKAEGLALAVAEEIILLLQERGINQTQLAGAMSVSRSHVSQLLTAPPNMTLLTLARLGIALGVEPKVTLDSERRLTQPIATLDHEDRATDQAFASSSTDSESNIRASIGGRRGMSHAFA